MAKRRAELNFLDSLGYDTLIDNLSGQHAGGLDSLAFAGPNIRTGFNSVAFINDIDDVVLLLARIFKNQVSSLIQSSVENDPIIGVDIDDDLVVIEAVDILTLAGKCVAGPCGLGLLALVVPGVVVWDLAVELVQHPDGDLLGFDNGLQLRDGFDLGGGAAFTLAVIGHFTLGLNSGRQRDFTLVPLVAKRITEGLLKGVFRIEEVLPDDLAGLETAGLSDGLVILVVRPQLVRRGSAEVRAALDQVVEDPVVLAGVCDEGKIGGLTVGGAEDDLVIDIAVQLDHIELVRVLVDAELLGECGAGPRGQLALRAESKVVYGLSVGLVDHVDLDGLGLYWGLQLRDGFDLGGGAAFTLAVIGHLALGLNRGRQRDFTLVPIVAKRQTKFFLYGVFLVEEVGPDDLAALKAAGFGDGLVIGVVRPQLVGGGSREVRAALGQVVQGPVVLAGVGDEGEIGGLAFSGAEDDLVIDSAVQLDHVVLVAVFIDTLLLAKGGAGPCGQLALSAEGVVVDGLGVGLIDHIDLDRLGLDSGLQLRDGFGLGGGAAFTLAVIGHLALGLNSGRQRDFTLVPIVAKRCAEVLMFFFFFVQKILIVMFTRFSTSGLGVRTVCHPEFTAGFRFEAVVLDGVQDLAAITNIICQRQVSGLGAAAANNVVKDDHVIRVHIELDRVVIVAILIFACRLNGFAGPGSLRRCIGHIGHPHDGNTGDRAGGGFGFPGIVIDKTAVVLVDDVDSDQTLLGRKLYFFGPGRFAAAAVIVDLGGIGLLLILYPIMSERRFAIDFVNILMNKALPGDCPERCAGWILDSLMLTVIRPQVFVRIAPVGRADYEHRIVVRSGGLQQIHIRGLRVVAVVLVVLLVENDFIVGVTVKPRDFIVGMTVAVVADLRQRFAGPLFLPALIDCAVPGVVPQECGIALVHNIHIDGVGFCGLRYQCVDGVVQCFSSFIDDTLQCGSACGNSVCESIVHFSQGFFSVQCAVHSLSTGDCAFQVGEIGVGAPGCVRAPFCEGFDQVFAFLQRDIVGLVIAGFPNVI